MEPTGTMIDYRKRRLSDIAKVRTKNLDYEIGRLDDKRPDRENQVMLDHASMLWNNLETFRERRRRARRYHRGDQWGDIIKDPSSNEYIREDEYIRAQGRVPLKQNIIRQLVKNLMGQYRTNPTKTMVYSRNKEDSTLGDMMGNAIRSVHDVNYTEQVYANIFMEFALSGMAVGKYSYRYIPDKDNEDIYIEPVNPNRLFFNADVEDPRLTDLRSIGEIHDMPLDNVITAFAKNKRDETEIKRWYSTDYYRDFLSSGSALTSEILDNIDFYIPSNPGMCRVIEVWVKKAEWRTYGHDYADGTYKILPYTMNQVEQLNAQRIMEAAQVGVPPEEVPLIQARLKYDQFWYVKYLTPYGHCLYEGETPYSHGEHPYIMALYPMIDGEVWGVVEDIIDQQRYVNRAITLMDFIIGASAKGVLLVHEDSVPDGMSVDSFSDNWTKVNGVILYTGQAGIPVPQQISNSSIPVGLQELLATQLKLSYDIMGIHQAIQGQQPKAGTPASLYAQEAQNATINLKDFMENFGFFREKADTKIMKLVLQFYQTRRNLIARGGDRQQEVVFDPAQIQDTDFDLKITQGTDTPVYRQVIEETLMTLLQGQLIDLKMFLEHSSLPFAEKLLDSIHQREQEMTQGGQGAPIDPALIQQMEQAQTQTGTDPRFQGMLNKMLAPTEKKARA